MSFISAYIHNIKRHYVISPAEKKSWLITSFIIALIVFFFIWRTTSFSIGSAITNIIILIVVSLISMWVFMTAAKVMAIWKKYTAEYKSWLNGLLIGFVISFVSYGFIPVLFPGVIEVKTIERLRHGKVFPGENKKEISFILTGTVYVMVLLTLIFQSLFKLTNFTFFKYGLIISALVVFFSILPFPHNLGLHLFFVNRKRYYFIFFFALIFCVTIIVGSSYSLLIAILTGIVFFFIAKDKKFNPLERDAKDL